MRTLCKIAIDVLAGKRVSHKEALLFSKFSAHTMAQMFEALQSETRERALAVAAMFDLSMQAPAELVAASGGNLNKLLQSSGWPRAKDIAFISAMVTPSEGQTLN